MTPAPAPPAGTAGPDRPGPADPEAPAVADPRAGRLPAVVTGRGPRLVLAHGFTQNAGAWGTFARRLAVRHEVVAVDLPGHGASTRIDGDLAAAAAGLGATGGPADYVGYSLGGRVALHLALGGSGVVRRLVLIGATPGIPDAAERAARRRRDEELADRLDPPGAAPAGLDDRQRRLDAFLGEWLAGPLFRSLPPAARALPARRRNDAAGLAASLRACGTGTQRPLWDRLGELSVPVLVVVGGLDDRFLAVGRRMVSLIGVRARLEVIAGAGHACHLEQPEAVADVVEAFLARQ